MIVKKKKDRTKGDPKVISLRFLFYETDLVVSLVY